MIEKKNKTKQKRLTVAIKFYDHFNPAQNNNYFDGAILSYCGLGWSILLGGSQPLPSIFIPRPITKNEFFLMVIYSRVY